MLQDILTAIADNLLGQVPILMGLIALVGLLLQRKPVEDVIGGTIRAAVGVVIMTIGIDVFVGGLVSFQAIVSSAVGAEPPAASNTLNDFLAGPGAAAPLMIAFGFVLHLVIVRIFPKANYVYLTGHLMLWMSIVVAACMVEVFGADVNRWVLVAAGSLVVASYWTLQPLWIGPLMRRTVKHDQFGLAHTTSSLALITGYASGKLGDPEKHDSEKIKFPKSIGFLKDMTVATAVVIAVIMLISLIFADPEVVKAQAGTMAPFAWGLMQALKFAGGIAVLMVGVRMFLAEIVPAFKGISDKLLPGSKPALDIPVVFPVAPTAVMVGFIASVVTFLVVMGVFAAAGWFVLVPPMIMLFFGGGAAGVFGNAVAGWRGAAFGGVLNGLILGFGQWIFWGLFAQTAPELATLADPDWYIVGGILIGLAHLFSGLGPAAIWLVAGIWVVVTVVVLVVLGQRSKDKEPTTASAATGS